MITKIVIVEVKSGSLQVIRDAIETILDHSTNGVTYISFFATFAKFKDKFKVAPPAKNRDYPLVYS